MNRRNLLTTSLSRVMVAAMPTRMNAQETTPTPLPGAAMEEYYWDFSKQDSAIQAILAYFQNADTAKRVAYTYAHNRNVPNIMETYEELDAGDLSGSVRVFEGTLLTEYRTQRWREVTMYVGSQDTKAVQVVANGKDSDARWVVKSLLQDGLPVTPYGYLIVREDQYS